MKVFLKVYFRTDGVCFWRWQMWSLKQAPFLLRVKKAEPNVTPAEGSGAQWKEGQCRGPWRAEHGRHP